MCWARIFMDSDESAVMKPQPAAGQRHKGLNKILTGSIWSQGLWLGCTTTTVVPASAGFSSSLVGMLGCVCGSGGEARPPAVWGCAGPCGTSWCMDSSAASWVRNSHPLCIQRNVETGSKEYGIVGKRKQRGRREVVKTRCD
jgi:hypothetical protein